MKAEILEIPEEKGKASEFPCLMFQNSDQNNIMVALGRIHNDRTLGDTLINGLWLTGRHAGKIDTIPGHTLTRLGTGEVVQLRNEYYEPS